MTSTSFNIASSLILENGMLRNEFFNTLMNMVARVMVVNNMYDNPWSWPKKGILEVGDKIEEIYIALAKIYAYDADNQDYPFNAEKPDVQTTFHKLNFQKYYKTRFTDYEVREAFTSMEGFDNFIQKVITNLYTTANYDEYLCYKYITARSIINGSINVEDWKGSSGGATPSGAQKSATIKAVTSKFSFMGNKYSSAHVNTWTPDNKKHVIMTADFKAERDNEFLAELFNLPLAEIKSKYNTIDSFGFTTEELARLDEIFTSKDSTSESPKYDPEYHKISSDENAALNNVECILVDEDFYQVYDVIIDMYYNEALQLANLNRYVFLHLWRIFSTSPYHNAVVFMNAGDHGLNAMAIKGIYNDNNVYKPYASNADKLVDNGYETGKANDATIPFALEGTASSGVVFFPHIADVDPEKIVWNCTSTDTVLGSKPLETGTIKLKRIEVPAINLGSGTTYDETLCKTYAVVIAAAVRADSSDVTSGAYREATLTATYGGKTGTATIKVAYKTT